MFNKDGRYKGAPEGIQKNDATLKRIGPRPKKAKKKTFKKE